MMRRHARLLFAAVVATSLALAAADVSAGLAAAKPLTDKLGNALTSAATTAGGAKSLVYETKVKLTDPVKLAAAKFIANKTEAPMALVRQKTVAAGDAIAAAIATKGAAAKPYLQAAVDKVQPVVFQVKDAVDAKSDATYGAAKIAVGNVLATKINATADAVDHALAAKLAIAMPTFNKLGDQLTDKIEAIAKVKDATLSPLLRAPSDAFVDGYSAILTQGSPLRTAIYPIHKAVDEAIAQKNRIEDGPVRDALAPVHGAVSKALEKAALRLEGPIAKQVAAPRAAIRGVVARVSDFVDGPGYNISKPVRTVVNHALLGAADFIEGDHSKYQEPTPNGGIWINHIGDFVGRNMMVPGVGRVASAMFGVIPKPPPRNPNLPSRPTDPVYPRAIDPSGAPSGQCKPWQAPEGYKHVLDYCKSMQNKPKEYFAQMWNKTTPPTDGQEFPLSGCVFGCLVGNDGYTRAQIETSIMFGWSGKCFGEERKNGVPTKFATTLNHDYLIPAGRTNEQRVGAYTGAGDMIFVGTGKYNPKGYYDGQPAWHFDDDRPNVDSFTAGGWRTLNTLFQAWADGVVDEFRDLGNGAVIGKTFYTPPIFRNRVRADTNFFMLMQACTKDGKFAWKPEDRQVPLIGDP